jgi:hypothetical protein
VSSFGINLDLQLRGESGVRRAVRVAEDLEKILNRINDKGLDLSKVAGSRKAGDLADFKNKFNALAKDIAAGKKKFGDTEVSVRRYLDAFKQLAANTKAGTPSFNEYTAAIAQLEKELEKIAHASENAKRAQLGLLSVEEEAAQLARQQAQLKADQKKEREAAARKKNAREAKREADAIARLNRQQERDARLAKERQKRQRGRAFGDLAASVGFPLLFGGGAGSVAGGAIGSLAGSALGMGFGGQILGSALGQQLDKATQAVTRFANTVSKASTSVDKLIGAVGVRGTATGTAARRAEALGIGGLARASLGSELESVIGEEGVNSLEKLSKSSDSAANSISKFGATLASGFAPILTTVNKTIEAALGGAPEVERLAQKRKDLEGLKAAGSQGFTIQRLEGEIARLEKAAGPALKKEKTLKEAIADVERGQLSIAEKTTELEQSRLSARRDDFAVAQGSLQVDRLTEKLNIINLNLRGKITKEKEQELKLSKKLTLEEIDAAKAARENARIEAQRQIQREQISGAISNIGMIQKEKDMQLQFNQMQQGRFELVEEEARAIEDRFNVNTMLLELENKRALIGVTEAERISTINRSFELRKRLATEQYYLDLQSLEQANAAYQLSRLQFEQELKLQNLRAGMAAQQQIRETSPFARETELLDPFFGGSRQLEIDQQIAFTEQLGLMETQLEDVIKQQEIFALNPTVLKGLEDQETSIRNQIANFKEYQPAIDEAALAQARFNEAMAIAVPVTDSLFNNLTAVVEGTKTAKEAFADFLRDIASLLMDAAKQMIATYIAIGVARLFAGMGSDPAGSQGNPFGSDVVVPGPGGSAAGGGRIPLNAYAEGGYVSGPTRALVGEGGESEYIIPESKMRESMARYSRGARGSSVIPEAGGSGTSGEGGGAAVAAPIDVRYTVERINSVDYVTADQFQTGMRQAASQGAKQGEQQTLKRLQMSSSTRKRIGM